MKTRKTWGNYLLCSPKPKATGSNPVSRTPPNTHSHSVFDSRCAAVTALESTQGTQMGHAGCIRGDSVCLSGNRHLFAYYVRLKRLAAVAASLEVE